MPGTIGMGLYEGYVAMDLALAKPNLRAEFEDDLKKICAGTKDFRQVLQEQILKYKDAYRIMEQRVISLDEKMGARLSETPRDSTAMNNEVPSHFPEVYKCPKCKIANMALKRAANTNFPFLTCLNFPDCKNTVWFSKDVVKDVVLSDKKCRRCGDDVYEFKIMFTTMYFKVLFDTPTGWYETCLRCDTKLRNTLGINLDQIKSVGRIIETSTAPVASAPTQPTNSLSLQNYPTSSSATLRGNSRNNQGPKKGSSNAKKPSTSKPTNTRTISTYLNRQAPSTSASTSSAITPMEEDDDIDMIAAVEAVDRESTIDGPQRNAAAEANNAVAALENIDMFDDDFDEIDFVVQSNNGRSTTSECNYEDLLDDDDDNLFDCIDITEVDLQGRNNNIQDRSHESRRPNTINELEDSEGASWGTKRRTNTTQTNSFTSTNSINNQRVPNSGNVAWGTKGRTNITQRSDLPSTSNQRVPIVPSDSDDMAWGTKGRTNTIQKTNLPSTNNPRPDIPDDFDDLVWGTKGKTNTIQKSNFTSTNNQRTDIPDDSDMVWGTEGRTNTIQRSNFTASNNQRPNVPDDSEEIAWGTKGRNNTTQRSNFSSTNNQRPNIPDDTENISWGTKGRTQRSNFSSSTNQNSNSRSDSENIGWGTGKRRNFPGTSSSNQSSSNNSEIVSWGTGNKRNFPGTSTSNQSSSNEEYSWGSSSNQRVDTDKENEQAIMEWSRERNKIRKQDAFNRRSGNFTSTSNQDNRNQSKEGGNQKMNCTKCGVSLGLLTVRKEGANTGRQFYSCRDCNFFQWADDTSAKSCKFWKCLCV